MLIGTRNFDLDDLNDPIGGDEAMPESDSAPNSPRAGDRPPAFGAWDDSSHTSSRGRSRPGAAEAADLFEEEVLRRKGSRGSVEGGEIRRTRSASVGGESRSKGGSSHATHVLSASMQADIDKYANLLLSHRMF